MKQAAAHGSAAIEPLADVTRLADLGGKRAASLRAEGLGLIADGRVAAVLLAGGQGTRLGSDAPKGCYDIGLPSRKSLFQYHAERIASVKALAAARKGVAADAVRLRLYVMTSAATDAETRAFFERCAASPANSSARNTSARNSSARNSADDAHPPATARLLRAARRRRPILRAGHAARAVERRQAAARGAGRARVGAQRQRRNVRGATRLGRARAARGGRRLRPLPILGGQRAVPRRRPHLPRLLPQPEGRVRGAHGAEAPPARARRRARAQRRPPRRRRVFGAERRDEGGDRPQGAAALLGGAHLHQLLLHPLHPPLRRRRARTPRATALCRPPPPCEAAPECMCVARRRARCRSTWRRRRSRASTRRARS